VCVCVCVFQGENPESFLSIKMCVFVCAYTLRHTHTHTHTHTNTHTHTHMLQVRTAVLDASRAFANGERRGGKETGREARGAPWFVFGALVSVVHRF